MLEDQDQGADKVNRIYEEKLGAIRPGMDKIEAFLSEREPELHSEEKVARYTDTMQMCDSALAWIEPFKAWSVMLGVFKHEGAAEIDQELQSLQGRLNDLRARTTAELANAQRREMQAIGKIWAGAREHAAEQALKRAEIQKSTHEAIFSAKQRDIEKARDAFASQTEEFVRSINRKYY